MANKSTFFDSLDRVFVLKHCVLDALLDGTFHVLYQSIGLGMVQCRTGVYNSTPNKVVLYLVGGKLYTIVHHNMVWVTFTHKYVLKTFHTHGNLGPGVPVVLTQSLSCSSVLHGQVAIYLVEETLVQLTGHYGKGVPHFVGVTITCSRQWYHLFHHQTST